MGNHPGNTSPSVQKHSHPYHKQHLRDTIPRNQGQKLTQGQKSRTRKSGSKKRDQKTKTNLLKPPNQSQIAKAKEPRPGSQVRETKRRKPKTKRQKQEAQNEELKA